MQQLTKTIVLLVASVFLFWCDGAAQEKRSRWKAVAFDIESTGQSGIISSEPLKKYTQEFNGLDEEDVKNFVPNDQAFTWLKDNVPMFDCPDSVLLKTYYYRWWIFRKHLKQTPDGFIFTEFITPVNHASTHNAISCALGHHIYEGRWLRDDQYINQYISFWLYTEQFQKKSKFHSFSSWLDDAVYNRFLVNRDTVFIRKLIPALDADYARWEEERQLKDGTFWQHDVKDGMEESISGGRRVKNIRPTINSYMYANAMALSRMGRILGMDSVVTKYTKKATDLKPRIQQLWNDSSSFYEVRLENGKFARVREAIGFVPWYFHLPPDNKTFVKAWDQLIDTLGFNAPWGQTTAERRHPQFRSHGVGTCEWDGAIWPFATTQTMKGLANLLTRYNVRGRMTPEIYYSELQKYARSHQKDGKIYIGEYQDEKNGDWLKGDHPRSRFYNHSGFADLIINDLVGLKPREDNTLEVFPLIPKTKWNWFCLEQVRYHDRDVTILWDRNGTRYRRGKGFMIFVDGKRIHHGRQLKHVKVTMP